MYSHEDIVLKLYSNKSTSNTFITYIR